MAYEAKSLYDVSSRSSTDTAASAPPMSSSLPMRDSSQEYVSRIVAAHLFPGTPQSEAGEMARPIAPGGNMTVLGILYSDAPSLSQAILKIDGQEKSYGVGDNLPGGGTLEEIASDHVIVLSDGGRSSLPLIIQSANYNARFPEISLAGANQDGNDSSAAELPSTASLFSKDSALNPPPRPAVLPIAADPLVGRKFPSLQTIRHDRRDRFKRIPPE